MDKYIVLMILTIIIFLASQSFAKDSSDICNSQDYICHKIGPNYMIIYPKKRAEPKQESVNRSHATYHIRHEKTNNEKDSIEVNLANLTWHAYDNGGNIIRSGHVSGGKDYCPDINSECRTVTGTFAIYYKGDESCTSSLYPIGRGGAPMPYCMYFHGGYALHGSNHVPNYNASHGCVRMSPEDAQWLNEEFVKIGLTRVNIHY